MSRVTRRRNSDDVGSAVRTAAMSAAVSTGPEVLRVITGVTFSGSASRAQPSQSVASRSKSLSAPVEK